MGKTTGTRRAHGLRLLGAIGASAALVLAGTAGAHAAPAPDQGPTGGGTTVTVPEPPPGVSAIAGYMHSVALDESGKAYAWGTNTQGQVGDGTRDFRNAPVPVPMPGGVGFTSIEAGYYNSVAIGDDGRFYIWGDGDAGQRGDGTVGDLLAPTAVPLPGTSEWVGAAAGFRHVYALNAAGEVYAWGNNGIFSQGAGGELGDGSAPGDPTGQFSLTPVRVALPAGVQVSKISSGSAHGAALTADGKIYTWGDGTAGQLGAGPGLGARNSTPLEVVAPAGTGPGFAFTDVSAGVAHTLALGNDGKAYAWGRGQFGQLGNGSVSAQFVPVEVSLPAGVQFTSISAGFGNSLAIGDDGATYAWGLNTLGQLGNGADDGQQSNVPVRVSQPAGTSAFTFVSTYGDHGIAVGDNGDIYAWGSNDSGQLGDPAIAGDSLVPNRVDFRVVVTEVTFDGIPGTNLTDNGDGTWSADTPAHAPGPVPVVVHWQLNGAVQDLITYVDGFTYIAAATITNPADARVAEGDPGVFVVEAGGDPAPTVGWEVSRDGGAWEPVAGIDGIQVSADGLTLTVEGRAEYDGYRFRATAENIGGSATSEPALLTVVVEEPAVEEPAVEEPPKTPAVGSPEKKADAQLVSTGGAGPLALGVIGALLVGGAALALGRRRRGIEH